MPARIEGREKVTRQSELNVFQAVAEPLWSRQAIWNPSKSLAPCSCPQLLCLPFPYRLPFTASTVYRCLPFTVCYRLLPFFTRGALPPQDPPLWASPPFDDNTGLTVYRFLPISVRIATVVLWGDRPLVDRFRFSHNCRTKGGKRGLSIDHPLVFFRTARWSMIFVFRTPREPPASLPRAPREVTANGIPPSWTPGANGYTGSPGGPVGRG